ncbi:MAG: hypothetical protein ACRDK3_16215 [Actinomycetota bacterium]
MDPSIIDQALDDDSTVEDVRAIGLAPGLVACEFADFLFDIPENQGAQ